MKKLKVYFKNDCFLTPPKEFNLDDLEINRCEIENGIFFLRDKTLTIIFAVPLENLLFYEVIEQTDFTTVTSFLDNYVKGELKEKENGSV